MLARTSVASQVGSRGLGVRGWR